MSPFCIPLPTFRLPFRAGPRSEDALSRYASADSGATLVGAVTEKGLKAVQQQPLLVFAEAAERLAKVRQLMKEAELDY